MDCVTLQIHAHVTQLLLANATYLQLLASAHANPAVAGHVGRKSQDLRHM